VAKGRKETVQAKETRILDEYSLNEKYALENKIPINCMNSWLPRTNNE